MGKFGFEKHIYGFQNWEFGRTFFNRKNNCWLEKKTDFHVMKKAGLFIGKHYFSYAFTGGENISRIILTVVQFYNKAI